MTTTPALEAAGLTKRHGRTVGIEDLDLIVEPGERYGVLGPNGAGKTTVIRLALGLLAAAAGTGLLAHLLMQRREPAP